MASAQKTSMPPLLSLVLIILVCDIHGFIFPTRSSGSKPPLTVRRDQELPDADTTYNINASGSFGSLLLKMQTQEKELQATNKTIATLDLDALPKHNSTMESDDLLELANDTTEQPSMDTMDYATAKSLDDAVVRLGGDADFHKAGLEVLSLDPLYQAQLDLQGSSPPTGASVLPLSQLEHYQSRIDRDRRLLAASITATIDSPAQWRLFCQEGGGLLGLLETIRLGARSITSEHFDKNSDDAWLRSHQEESIIVASSACRSIRDLCAVSPEVAAIVTDGMLRVNAAWDGGLFSDFCTLLEYANDYTEAKSSKKKNDSPFRLLRRSKREVRVRCLLYVNQLLLALTFASDDAVVYMRNTKGLSDAVIACSSYARKEKRRRWLRYPREIVRYLWRKEVTKAESARNPFLEAAKVKDTLEGQVQKTANLVLASIGCNQWTPKIPGQRGLRILCLDGGGSRGISAVTALNKLTEYAGDGAQPADSFDIICGTSTGGIISFLTGLRGESSLQAVER